MFHVDGHKSGVLAGSPEPQSISGKPGSIDRVLPAAWFLEARNSAENKTCWHLSKEQLTKKLKYDGRAKACFPPMLCCKVIVWSWESQTLWALVFIQKDGKISGLISSRMLHVFINLLRNMHCLSIYDFLLPDIAHQSFPLTFERLESYFTSICHFHFNLKKLKYISIRRDLTA